MGEREYSPGQVCPVCNAGTLGSATERFRLKTGPYIVTVVDLPVMKCSTCLMLFYPSDTIDAISLMSKHAESSEVVSS